MRPSAWSLVGVVAFAVVLGGCGSVAEPSAEPSAQETPLQTVESKSAPASEASVDMTAALTAAVRAAVANDPNGELPRQYIASVGELALTAGDDWILARDTGRPWTAGERRAIVAGLPTVTEFVPVDTLPTLLVGAAQVDGDGVIVAWEYSCGSEGALCNSGGAVRVIRGDGGWIFDRIVGGWIA